MNLEAVKGFKDYTGEEAKKRALIMDIIKNYFEKYGFELAETPIIEYEEFVRGDNPNDSAVRDIFKLQDRGKRNLALRYEFTFQLKRLMRNKKIPYKRYQIGYVFRDEPIKKGRMRQFIQCDADVIGSTIKDEAECLSIFKEVLSKLGIEYTIYINNRELLNEILEKENIESKNQNDILREIDKLDKLSEEEVKNNLKKFKAEKILSIFKNKEKYFEKYDSYSKIKELKKYCEEFDVKVEFRPFLTRGLSYYNSSVFEVWSKKLKVSICGGGSYMLNGVQSTGISFGLEPIMLLSKIKNIEEKYLVISLGQDKEAIKIAKKLRSQNKIVSLYYGKPSKALDYANSYNFSKVIFVGEEEVKSGNIKIKNMENGKETIIKM